MCPWFLISYPSIVPSLPCFLVVCLVLNCCASVGFGMNKIPFSETLWPAASVLFFPLIQLLTWLVEFPKNRYEQCLTDRTTSTVCTVELSVMNSFTHGGHSSIYSHEIGYDFNCTSMWCWLKYFLRKNVKSRIGYIGKYFAVITITKDYL